MIITSKIPFIDQNTGKINQLCILHKEYLRMMNLYLDYFWDYYGLDHYDYKKHSLRQWSFYPIHIIQPNEDSILSGRILKCIQTQVMGMIKSSTSKLNKLFYVLQKEQEKQKPDSVKISSIQRRIQNNRKITKPYISPNTPMELNTTTFNKKDNTTKTKDFVYQLSSIWSREYKKKHNLTNKINFVVNSHMHDRKLKSLGKEMTSFLVSPTGFNIRYDIKTTKVKSGIIAAIDQGISYCVTMVDEFGNIQQTKPNNHNYDLKKILKQILKKKKGSVNFSDCQEHRTNYVNWAINQLDLKGIREIRLEGLFDMTRGRKTNRFLSSFPYVEIRTKLQKVCSLAGVQLVEQSSMYRSQRCSSCGFVQKDNRKGDVFCCKGCGYTEQADVNAAKNHLANIKPLNSYNSSSHTSGFYWN